MDCCALCGQKLKVDIRARWNAESHMIVKGSRQLLLTPMESRIFDALWRASERGGVVAFVELVTHAYEHRPDGGPLAADKCVAVHLVHLRRKLGRVGVAIFNMRGAGYGVHGR